MSVTLTQLTYQALRDIGALRPGQTTSTDVLNDCLTEANQMLQMFLMDELMVFTILQSDYTLTALSQFYTIGPNENPPNFRATRPTKIENANIIINTVSPVVRRPMTILNHEEYANIRVQQIPSALPLKIYYDYGFTTSQAGTIFIWPGPISGYILELFTWQQLSTFPDLVTPLTFPPGYERLLRKNLAVSIAPMMRLYAKVPGPGGMRSYDPLMLEEVKMQAVEAKMWVKSFNAPAAPAKCDPMYNGKNHMGGAWNYGTGEYN